HATMVSHLFGRHRPCGCSPLGLRHGSESSRRAARRRLAGAGRPGEGEHPEPGADETVPRALPCRFVGPVADHDAGARLPVISLPLSLYRLRWDFAIVALAFLAVAVVSGIWAGTHPEVLETFGDREFRRQFAEHDFVDYYKENPNGSFAVGVWTNNAWIPVQF